MGSLQAVRCWFVRQDECRRLTAGGAVRNVARASHDGDSITMKRVGEQKMLHMEESH